MKSRRRSWPRFAALSLFSLLSLLFLASCASLQDKCAKRPWLLCGDRIEVHKDYVYLDDPAFLYHHKTVALQQQGIYGFRLGLFFNPYRFQSAQVKAEIHPYRDPKLADSSKTGMVMVGGAVNAVCRIGNNQEDEIKLSGETSFKMLDSSYRVLTSVKKERMTLQFLCQGYQPQWGREDTLVLNFVKEKSGVDSSEVLALPFTTSFHGPVYSFAVGTVLLISLTVMGELLSKGR